VDIKRYNKTVNKQQPTSKFMLKRVCPGCNKEFNMSEVAWITNPQCFMNGSSACPLVQAQNLWIKNNPIDERMHTTENLYAIGNEKIANKFIDELLDDIIGS